MPKRSVNRPFFESSLEMKCLFFFGVALSVVTLASIYLYWKSTEEIVKAQNPETAKLWANQYLIAKHRDYFSAKKSNDETLSAFYSSVATQDGGDSLTEVDKAIRDMLDTLGERIRNRDVRCDGIRPLIRKRNILDPPISPELEQKHAKGGEYRKILDLFPTVRDDYSPDMSPEYHEQVDPVTDAYQYYEAVRIQPSCIGCHEMWDQRDPKEDPYRVGELVGVVHVTIPKPPAQDKIKRFWAILLGVGIVTAFLSLIAFYAVIRNGIIKPLRKLRDVAESISRGDITKRAELHTGDEFESLGEAFNRMLRHLVAAQEKLRKAYNDQEIRVDQLAHLTLQLSETNRVKSDFMATMSHELRTPLNSILGFSDVLGSIETLTEKQKRYVENINKSGRALLTMINDILDMAKIESGRMKVQISSFPIERTVAAQCDMAKPLLDKKNIDLQVRIDDDLPPIRQDESRIQQILNNLLSNAIKFTPEGGRIKIDVRRIVAAPSLPPPMYFRTTPRQPAKPIPTLELSVIDTGVGISEEDQLIVFEKFRQGKSATGEGDMMKREHSGSGLGLSIVKEICKMLEGEITLESQLGLGSTFTVRLPWMLEPRSRNESEMMAEIQEFSKNRVAKAAARDVNDDHGAPASAPQ